MNENLYAKLIEQAKKDRIKRYVAGAVIINNNQKILILQRPKKDFMGGIYELPSGKVEREEKLKEALFREIKEETNLEVSKVVKYISHFDYKSKNGELTRQFNFLVEPKSPFEIILTEHENYAWIRKKEVSNYNLSENVKKIINRYEN